MTSAVVLWNPRFARTGYYMSRYVRATHHRFSTVVLAGGRGGVPLFNSFRFWLTTRHLGEKQYVY